MGKGNLEFKIMKTKEFEAYYNVKERQARRKKENMLKELGLSKGDPIFFPAFCAYVKRTQEEMKRLFGW
jgi:hypothetical protein